MDTTYSYPILTIGGPYFYSVAAFDSCYTAATPVTFQTSAKADINGTVDLSSNVKMCDQETELNWTSYSGQSVIEYQIWTLNNGVWNPVATTPDTFATITLFLESHIKFWFRQFYPMDILHFQTP